MLEITPKQQSSLVMQTPLYQYVIFLIIHYRITCLPSLKPVQLTSMGVVALPWAVFKNPTSS